MLLLDSFWPNDGWRKGWGITKVITIHVCSNKDSSWHMDLFWYSQAAVSTHCLSHLLLFNMTFGWRWPRWNPFANTESSPELITEELSEGAGGTAPKKGPLKKRRIDHQPVRDPTWSNSLWAQLSFVLRWGILFPREGFAGVCLSWLNARWRWTDGSGAVGAHAVRSAACSPVKLHVSPVCTL